MHLRRNTTAISGSVLALALGLIIPTSAVAKTLSGDAITDFSGPSDVIILDPAGIDVGVPLAFPADTISGNDMEDIRFSLDSGTDTLFVGFNTYGIGGDVDGDGDPDSTSATLQGLGGIDNPLFGGTESFALCIDVDQDGILDVIAGVSAFTDTSGFTVSLFDGSSMTPSLAFGAPLVSNTGALFANPSASAPDIEFTISNFSTLPASSGLDGSSSISVMAFIGSFSDAGIGEDFLPSLGLTAPVDFPEICDGLDNDGDGEVDEGAADCNGGIDGRVFLDQNKDGVQGDDEPGIEGAEVLLSGPDCDGDGEGDILSVYTDEQGDYAVDGLCQGDWTVAHISEEYDVSTTPTSVEVEVVSGEVTTVDFGVCRAYITLTPGYWKNHRCSVEPYLPITIGTLTFSTFEEVSEYLNQPNHGNKALKLGQHLLAASLNDTAFGDGAFTWGDIDGDGEAESVAQLIAAGNAAFLGSDSSLQIDLAGELDSFNNSGSDDLPDFFPGCAAEGQGGGKGGKGKGGKDKEGKLVVSGAEVERLMEAGAACDSGPSQDTGLLGFLLLGLPLALRRRS